MIQSEIECNELNQEKEVVNNKHAASCRKKSSDNNHLYNKDSTTFTVFTVHLMDMMIYGDPANSITVITQTIDSLWSPPSCTFQSALLKTAEVTTTDATITTPALMVPHIAITSLSNVTIKAKIIMMMVIIMTTITALALGLETHVIK